MIMLRRFRTCLFMGAGLLSGALLTGCSLDAPPPNPERPDAAAQTVQAAPAPTVAQSTSAPPQGAQPNAGTPALQNAPVQNVPAVQTAPLDDPNDPSNFAPINAVSMVLVWYDLPGLYASGLVQTRVLLAKQAGATRMSFSVPPLNMSCDGVLRFLPTGGQNRAEGDFEFTCSNRETVRGVMVPIASPPSINGQGVDTAGRSVLFSIDFTPQS